MSMTTFAIPPAVARLCEAELLSRLPQLKAAIGSAEFSAAREHAHALKGMAANFGLRDLAQALAGLEDAARDHSWPLDGRLAAVERAVGPALAALSTRH
jgi:HPt (histidine-containing phosphotransfer) domain-containing protein